MSAGAHESHLQAIADVAGVAAEQQGGGRPEADGCERHDGATPVALEVSKRECESHHAWAPKRLTDSMRPSRIMTTSSAAAITCGSWEQITIETLGSRCI